MFLSSLLLLGTSLTVQPEPPLDEAVVQSDDGEVLLTAERVYRTDGQGPLIAEGDVRAASDGQFLRADRVIYDVEADTVTATGEVAVRDEDGTLYFADQVVLSSDLKNGIVAAFAAELAPSGNLAAATAIRRENGRNELRRAAFTLCPVCDEGFRRDRPIWQLKARRVVQDEEAQVLRFHNAFIEIFGVPALYLPYAQVPDPSVERATGFLAPQVGSSTRTGIEAELPYYVAISPYQDLTFAPRHFELLGTLLKGEWRRNTPESRAVVQAGFINPTNDLSEEAGNPDDTRWHWFSRYERDLPLGFEMVADIDAVSDKGYLLTYDMEPAGELQDNIPILRPDRLTSSLNFSRNTDRSYTDISGYLFQTLRFNEDQEFTAQALPRLRHGYVFDVLGGEFELGGSFLSLQREQGLDSLRASAHATYTGIHYTESGHRFELFGELRGDGYSYSSATGGIQRCNVQDRFYEACRQTLPGDLADEAFTATRFLPTLGAEWAYPLARLGDRTSLIIEPRVQAVISPDRDFEDEIFNEDSQFFQFDTVTLFDYNKATGLDLWEDGQRVNVGLSATAAVGNAFTVNSMLGAQFRDAETDSFDPDSGLGDTTSDVVGAVDMRIGNKLVIDNRFRVDDQSGQFRRLESSVAGAIGPFSGGLNYLRIQGAEYEVNQRLDEFLILSGGLAINRHISIAASQAQNLDSGSTTNTQIGIRLANQCTAVSIRYRFDDSTIEGFEQNQIILVKFDILGFQ